MSQQIVEEYFDNDTLLTVKNDGKVEVLQLYQYLMMILNFELLKSIMIQFLLKIISQDSKQRHNERISSNNNVLMT